MSERTLSARPRPPKPEPEEDTSAKSADAKPKGKVHASGRIRQASSKDGKAHSVRKRCGLYTSQAHWVASEA